MSRAQMAWFFGALQKAVTSADGKKLTITTTGTDAQGQNIDSVAVYDKQ